MKKKKNAPNSSSKPLKGQVYESLSTKKKWGLFFLFALISLVLYHKTFNYGFVLDDKIVYSENKFVEKGMNGIVQLLSTDSFQGYFGEQKNLVQGARYRPCLLYTSPSPRDS